MAGNASTDDLLRHAVRRLAMGHHLSAAESAGAFDVVMSGGATAAQVAALLMGLRVKGETPSEVAGAARALRRAMITLDADRPTMLVDTCGTGGGAVPTFNISTAAAIVAAACGVRIAKHGNRSFTSRSGSADLLEALGVQIDLTPAHMASILREVGLVFMFAPLMHPAMRHVGPVRRELAIPTVMNMIGPLANPAAAGRQVIGVADRGRLELIAGALHELGTERALVVHARSSPTLPDPNQPPLSVHASIVQPRCPDATPPMAEKCLCVCRSGVQRDLGRWASDYPGAEGFWCILLLFQHGLYFQ